MKDNSLAVTYGPARKDGLGAEDELAMKRVLTTLGDELAVQDRLLSQGGHRAGTALSAAQELPALLSTHSSGRAGKGSSPALPLGV